MVCTETNTLVDVHWLRETAPPATTLALPGTDGLSGQGKSCVSTKDMLRQCLLPTVHPRLSLPGSDCLQWTHSNHKKSSHVAATCNNQLPHPPPPPWHTFVGLIVANLLDAVSDDLLEIYLGLCRDFTKYHYHSCLCGCLCSQQMGRGGEGAGERRRGYSALEFNYLQIHMHIQNNTCSTCICTQAHTHHTHTQTHTHTHHMPLCCLGPAGDKHQEQHLILGHRSCLQNNTQPLYTQPCTSGSYAHTYTQRKVEESWKGG